MATAFLLFFYRTLLFYLFYRHSCIFLSWQVWFVSNSFLIKNTICGIPQKILEVSDNMKITFSQCYRRCLVSYIKLYILSQPRQCSSPCSLLSYLHHFLPGFHVLSSKFIRLSFSFLMLLSIVLSLLRLDNIKSVSLIMEVLRH